MIIHDKLYRMHDKKDWVGARRLLRKEMRTTYDDGHWLMTKMAETYNLEGKHSRALAWARRALKIMARCPTARWEQYYALSSIKRRAEAARILRALIRRPVKSYLDAGDCSKSKSWVRTFITDCYHMLAWEEWLRGRYADGLAAQRQHLRRRLQGSKFELGDSLRVTRAGIRYASAFIRERRKRRGR